MFDLIGIIFVVSTPWLVAIAWTWSQAPDLDAVPPSLADRLRNRF